MLEFCHIDDVLVFGATQEQHDLNLMAVLKNPEAAGITLKPTKCELSKTSEKFLGHLLDKTRIIADPNKTEAVLHMDTPQSEIDLRRGFFVWSFSWGSIIFMSSPPESTIKGVTKSKKMLGYGVQSKSEHSSSRKNLLDPLC